MGAKRKLCLHKTFRRLRNATRINCSNCYYVTATSSFSCTCNRWSEQKTEKLERNQTMWSGFPRPKANIEEHLHTSRVERCESYSLQKCTLHKPQVEVKHQYRFFWSTNTGRKSSFAKVSGTIRSCQVLGPSALFRAPWRLEKNSVLVRGRWSLTLVFSIRFDRLTIKSE